MGFFDMLFSGIGSLFSAAVSVVSEVVSTVKTYFTAKEIVTKTVYDERDKKQDQIHELNQEIQFLRAARQSASTADADAGVPTGISAPPRRRSA